jgi:putative transposase
MTRGRRFRRKQRSPAGCPQIAGPAGQPTDVGCYWLQACPQVAADVSRLAMATRPSGFLPRLAPEFYRGHAFVFWTHTVKDRGTGWLDARFHSAFREIALHAAAREQLLCPIYTLMPDHMHLIWLGAAADSDQRHASRFLREQLRPHIAPHDWQHQPHDRVLRDEQRETGALAATCSYIAENPVRAGLAPTAANWPYIGCIVPGFPDLHPLQDNFWELFWRAYNSAVELGRIGKMKSP